MKETLNDIAIKYGADKSSLDHGYTKFYEKHFNNLNIEINKLLEFGIYKGQSLNLWNEYFPKTKIVGVDLHDFKYLENENINTFAANVDIRDISEFESNVTNPWLIKLYNEFIGGKTGIYDVFKTYGGNFDIIIDDAPHTVRSNQTLIGYCFQYLTSGGLYVIEDLHVSKNIKEDNYNNFPFTEKTTLWVFENFIKTGKIESDFMTDNEKKYLEDNIDKVTIEMANYSEIIFITKK